MAVTKEQILAAADQIAAAGERPTLEAVRQIVGGSYTTISPVLNEWKARQKEATAPLREPAPQAVGDRLAMMVPHNQYGMVVTLVMLILVLNAVAIVLRSRVFKKLRGQ